MHKFSGRFSNKIVAVCGRKKTSTTCRSNQIKFNSTFRYGDQQVNFHLGIIPINIQDNVHVHHVVQVIFGTFSFFCFSRSWNALQRFLLTVIKYKIGSWHRGPIMNKVYYKHSAPCQKTDNFPLPHIGFKDKLFNKNLQCQPEFEFFTN